jgi:hypothetical protein
MGGRDGRSSDAPRVFSGCSDMVLSATWRGTQTLPLLSIWDSFGIAEQGECSEGENGGLHDLVFAFL